MRNIGTFDASTNDRQVIRESEQVEFKMEGVDYTFVAPPIGDVTEAVFELAENQDDVGANLRLMKLQNEWLADGLGEQWPAVKARLQDPSDPVNRMLLSEVTEALMREVSGGRPPTSSGGSSRQPPAAPSLTDGAQSQGSTGTG